MNTVEIIGQLWPVFAAIAGWVAWTIWWAATKEAQIRELQEASRSHANHSGEIMLIKATLENLTDKVGELIDELRSPRSRNR